MTVTREIAPLLEGPTGEDDAPVTSPEEELACQAELLFDFKGHPTLYARFTGKDGLTTLALLQAAQNLEGMPVIEARAVGDNFELQHETLDSVLAVSDLALVDSADTTLASLRREKAGQPTIGWLESAWIVCVPMRGDKGPELRLRATPAEGATASRLAIGAIADRDNKQ